MGKYVLVSFIALILILGIGFAEAKTSPTCGNGKIESLEGCDNGALNTNIPCVAGYGKVCSYCTKGCRQVNIYGAMCGDGVINGGEQCESGRLQGLGCVNFLTYSGGSLKCNKCRFDFSGCYARVMKVKYPNGKY